MISYEQLRTILPNPPSRDLLSLYNDLDARISGHPKYIKDNDPFSKLNELGNFCIGATSIQTNYIAFVLGKCVSADFPDEVMRLFFNIDPDYNLQFAQIRGRNVDGCIYLIHRENQKYDLQKIYDRIYVRESNATIQ